MLHTLENFLLTILAKSVVQSLLGHKSQVGGRINEDMKTIIILITVALQTEKKRLIQ